MTGRSSRYRLLSDEEIELWRHVAHTVAPRPGSSVPARRRSPGEDLPPSEPPVAQAEVKPGRRWIAPSYTPPQSTPRPSAPPLAPLERQFRKKVARGRIGIERAIDLHGLNQVEAHGALRGFLRGAHADQLRLVLVVTGKGSRTTAQRDAGILRRAVPHWLRELDLRDIVLGFEEASRPHGGGGALYIRLRPRRS